MLACRAALGCGAAFFLAAYRIGPFDRLVAAALAALIQQQAPVILQIAVIALAAALIDQPQAVGGEFDQMGIVAHQHDGAVIIVQRLHQRLAGIDIQMVGRLVEQQDMRLLMGHQGEQQPCLFAAGQLADLGVGLAHADTEARQMGAARLVIAQRLQALHQQERRGLKIEFVLLMLGEVAHFQLRGTAHGSSQRCQAPGQQLHHGGFAVAVRPQQGDAVVHVEPQVEMAQHRLAGRIADLDMVERR